LSTSPVRGDDANSVFAHLGKELGAPKWNFYKYLIDRDGKPVENFASMTEPMSEKLTSKVEEALK